MTDSLAPLPTHVEDLLPGGIDNHMGTDVPLCLPDTTGAVPQAMLVGSSYVSVADVAVCEHVDSSAHRLLGLIPLENALAAQPDELAADT